MRFCVDDDVCKREEIVGGKEEVEVFECFGLSVVSIKQINREGRKGDIQARNSPYYPSSAAE